MKSILNYSPFKNYRFNNLLFKWYLVHFYISLPFLSILPTFPDSVSLQFKSKTLPFASSELASALPSPDTLLQQLIAHCFATAPSWWAAVELLYGITPEPHGCCRLWSRLCQGTKRSVAASLRNPGLHARGPAVSLKFKYKISGLLIPYNTPRSYVLAPGMSFFSWSSSEAGRWSSQSPATLHSEGLQEVWGHLSCGQHAAVHPNTFA